MLNLSSKINLYPNTFSHIHLVNTDIVEPELLIHKIGVELKEKYPNNFICSSSDIFFKLHYTPPYETFIELKRLIIQLHHAAEMHSIYQGLICIDITEYANFPEDEYFTILLKYLYDNFRHCPIILLCSQCSFEKFQRLNNVCLRYFSTEINTLSLYKKDTLCELITSSCAEVMITIKKDALELLASSLEDNIPPIHRNLQLIDRIISEIAYQSKTNSITQFDVLSNINKPSSTISLLSKDPITYERRKTNEHTI